MTLSSQQPACRLPVSSLVVNTSPHQQVTRPIAIAAAAATPAANVVPARLVVADTSDKSGKPSPPSSRAVVALVVPTPAVVVVAVSYGTAEVTTIVLSPFPSAVRDRQNQGAPGRCRR
jgi:hypothetical protein